ncbi:MAG: ImmA/IrrE family metallo-endopeptidase, partial [Actinobacteria bacterium]|nr:ImmA/IrrE family metallo-endopeptidase [Actinomycetota bacterium]
AKRMDVSVANTTYEDPRAHAVRERYLGLFAGPELPVPVEAIAGDLLGLRIEESWDIDCSGMLLPAERRIVLNAEERIVGRNDPPLRRFRFTIAHEIGHWVCHCLEGRAPSPEPSYCRPVDLTDAADRTIEREANVFAAELLMPEPAVRTAWAELGEVEACASRFDVSPTAMEWRLYSFGILDKRPQ